MLFAEIMSPSKSTQWKSISCINFFRFIQWREFSQEMIGMAYDQNPMFLDDSFVLSFSCKLKPLNLRYHCYVIINYHISNIIHSLTSEQGFN